MQTAFIAVLAAGAGFAAGALTFSALSWVRRGRTGPLSSFRFSAFPHLDDAGLCFRDDLGPGAPCRLIAAGPRDCSPRAVRGDNVLSDLDLGHTEAAALVAGELFRPVLLALYRDAEAIRSAAMMGSTCPPRHLGSFRGFPLSLDDSMPWGDVGPVCAQPVAADDPAILGDIDPRDPLGLDALDCAADTCPTPSICRQCGACADTVATVDTRD